MALSTDKPNPPTAILLSDILDTGAIDAVHDLSLRSRGALRRRFRGAAATLTFLIAAVRGQSQRPHQVLKTTLVMRESTGPAPLCPSAGRNPYQPLTRSPMLACDRDDSLAEVPAFAGQAS